MQKMELCWDYGDREQENSLVVGSAGVFLHLWEDLRRD